MSLAHDQIPEIVVLSSSSEENSQDSNAEIKNTEKKSVNLQDIPRALSEILPVQNKGDKNKIEGQSDSESDKAEDDSDVEDSTLNIVKEREKEKNNIDSKTIIDDKENKKENKLDDKNEGEIDKSKSNTEQEENDSEMEAETKKSDMDNESGNEMEETIASENDEKNKSDIEDSNIIVSMDSEEDGVDKKKGSKKTKQKKDTEKDLKKNVTTPDDEEKSEESEDESDEQVGLLDRPVEVTGSRQRKKVNRLEISIPTPKENKVEIYQGSGEKLRNIPIIEEKISKTKAVDLQVLHKIIYGTRGTLKTIKKHLRDFSGFPDDLSDTDKSNKKKYMSNLTNKDLNEVCKILHLIKKGKKEDVIETVMGFLQHPKDPQKKSTEKKKAKKEKKSLSKKSTGGKTKVSTDTEGEEKDIVSSNSEDSDEEEQPENKTPKKRGPKKKEPKAKVVKEKSKKGKRKREISDSEEDEKPLAKKQNIPTDKELSEVIEDILKNANLQEITMKIVIEKVFTKFADCDLDHKKTFIKNTIKSVISR